MKPAPKPGKNEKPAKKLKKQPEWLEGDGMTVCNLILSVQKTDCNSAKLITELTKLHKKVNFYSLDVWWISDDFCSVLDGSRGVHGGVPQDDHGLLDER